MMLQKKFTNIAKNKMRNSSRQPELLACIQVMGLHVKYACLLFYVCLLSAEKYGPFST